VTDRMNGVEHAGSGLLRVDRLAWDRRTDAVERAFSETRELCSSLPRNGEFAYQLSSSPESGDGHRGRLDVLFRAGGDPCSAHTLAVDLQRVLGAHDHRFSTELLGDDEGRRSWDPFVAEEVAELAQRTQWLGDGEVLTPGADVSGDGRLVIGRLAPAGDSLRRLADQMLAQPEASLVRVLVAPTTLTGEEMDAVLSLVSDEPQSRLTRLIRRAEGGQAATQRLLDLEPAFEVRVFVATAGRLNQSLLRTAASCFSPAHESPGGHEVYALPHCTMVAPDSTVWAAFTGSSLNPSEGAAEAAVGLGRLHRLFGPAQLATCLRLPVATEPSFPGMVVDSARNVAPASLPDPCDGLVLGEARRGGVKSVVSISSHDLSRHLYLCGQTGTGKSSLVEQLAIQDIGSGGGVCVIDPHGDLVERLEARIPPHRRADVIVFDPTDPTRRLGLNPMLAENDLQEGFVVQDLAELFYSLFDPQRTGIIGPRFESWLRWATLTLLDAQAYGAPPATLLDVPRLFTDDEFLKERFRFVHDRRCQEFWIHEMGQTSAVTKSEMLGYFASKFERFQSNTIMRSILESGRNDLDFDALMDRGAIVLVNLSKGRIGEVNSNLLGHLVMSRIWLAALGRAGRPAAERRAFTVYVDEFQNFTTSEFDELLSESRKFGLRLVLANQFFSQLRPQVAQALLGNVGTRLYFRVGPADAQMLEPSVSPEFSHQDLSYLPNFTAACVLLSDGQPLRPFTLHTVAPVNLTSGQPAPELAEVPDPRGVLEAATS